MLSFVAKTSGKYVALFYKKLKYKTENGLRSRNIKHNLNINLIMKNKLFDIEKMIKASKAAGGLAKWCKAIRDYSESL